MRAAKSAGLHEVDNPVVLRVTDALIEVSLFDSDDFHRISSVVW